ncbi:glycosyltransferase family 4 protein, partial [Clostridium perfringens]
LEFCKLKGKKIIISIGNITDNKNQIELVEATKRLSFDENILVVLFGNERDDQKVRKKIIDENLENTIILAGFCDNLNRFWELVDLNVLLSLNEGFGLSIIEGYMHGIPSVTFSDLDAVEDIYDSSSTILIEKRETSAVVEAIKKGLEIDWKADKIKEIGSKFSMEKIAREYVKLYNKQLGEKK